MRPLLAELTLGPILSALIAIVGFAIAVLLAARASGRALGPSIKAALEAVLTLGVLESAKKKLPLAPGRAPPDLLVPGAIGAIGLGCLAWNLAGRGPVVFPLLAYPVCLMLGFGFMVVLTLRRARRRGIEAVHVLDVAMIALIAGIVGARAFFVLQFWDEHFADKPAVIVAAPPRPALAAGDELTIAVGDGAARTITFGGDESSLDAVVRRLADGLVPVGAKATPVVSIRKGRDGSVVPRERGIRIETLARGESARLRIVGGSAFAKLGLAAGREERGERVPWTRTLMIWNGGIVFYGGLLLAAAMGLAVMRARGLAAFAVADLVASTMALGLAFGRVGCTLNGCCWGREAAPGEPSIVFPGPRQLPPFGSPAWMQHAHDAFPIGLDRAIDYGKAGGRVIEELAPQLKDGSLPVVPVQIYAIILDILLFITILVFDRKKRRSGSTFFAFLCGYAVVRFVIEHFRGDHSDYAFLLGYPLTVSQRVALATFAIGALGLAWRRGPADAPEATDPAQARRVENKSDSSS